MTSTTSYRRYANDGICNTTATVSIGTWTVNVRAAFSSGEISSTGETICNGGNRKFSIGNTTSSSGGNGSITYSWRSSADGYAAAIPSVNGIIYTPPLGLTSTTSYRRYANDGVCNTTPTVSSGTWTVTVRAAFTSGEISSTGETICNGGTPTTTIGNTTASSGGNESITYYWRSSVDGFDVAIPSATSATYMPPAGLTSTTSYRRYANDGLCNLSSTVSVGTWTVTVLPVFVTGTISSTGETICNGGTPTTTIGNITASSGGNGSVTYSWRSSADGFASAIPLATAATYTPPAGLTSTTTYKRYANDGVCNTIPIASIGSWIVTVLPAFTTGTISSTGETICSGGTPILTIGNTTASTGGNASITYSWRSSADGFSAAIPTATAATYLPPVGLTTTTSYRRYANDGLCNTTPSVSTGTWTVTVGTAFSSGEISSIGETICYGGNPTLIGNTTASSGGNGIITYSWRSSSDGYVAAIPSATAATYTPPPGLITTTSYRRYANDGLCNTTATVSIGTWTVTVRPIFSSGEISSTGETICNGGTPTLTIGNTTASTGGNGSFTYSWRSSADGYIAAIPLATSATYTPPAGLTSTTSYRRYANDGLCNTTAIVSIGTWTVTVRAAFSSGEISSTGERICNVGNPTITIGSTTASSGGNGIITYSWRSSADGYIAAIPLASSATYVPPAGLTSTTSYRRYANDGLCNTTPTVSAGTWTVTYLPTFSSGEISSTGETICYNGNPVLIGSTTASSGGDASITYKWQANGVDISNSNSPTYDPPTGLTTTTTYTRYAKDGICNLTFALSSGIYTVTVRPNFSAGTISSTGEIICYNGNPLLIGSTTASSGGDASITYKWQANGVDIGNSNSTTYDPPTGLTASTTYTRYAKDGTCNLTYALSSGTWLVVVNALPSPTFIAEPGATACPSIDVTYSTQSGQFNYIWTIPGILNTDYTITSGGTTSSNTVTLKWLTTGSKTVTINYSNSNNCTAASATSSIATIVKSINTVGNASSTPTICINTALTNIIHLTTGATGISGSGINAANGLPAGVSASWTSNTITISGTPSSSGIFNYSIPLTGGCGVITATGTISVTANNTVTRTSAAASVAQTVCINTSMTPITYSTIGATGATFSGLPAGVNGVWSNNIITISGIPTISVAAQTYTVTLTGGCGVITTTGTITVSANNTATRSTAIATETQVVCINTAISNITYATTVATGANVSNLPSGISSSWSNNILTISGTPTVAGSAKTYTVNLTGGCGVFTTTGTIAVTPNNTVTRTSAASTIAQTVCINSAITSITYSTTGATGATFSGLPAGVSGVWSNNTITISGTPTISVAAQTYSITLTGGCGVITTTGTITVLANNTVTRTSAAGTDAQSVCANTAMTPIIYATTIATGATVTNLPSGISSSWSNNVLTISGTPTVVGTALTYTITLTGGCGIVTTTGTIAVKPKNTIALSSLTGTDNQLKCINTTIDNITYSTTGATGANFTGLPVGVSGIWSNDAIVLSGSPSVSGSFNYKISLIGGCTIADKLGDINVTPENTITLSSTANTDSQSICIGKSINTIEYTTVGAAGFTITGLPTGLQAVFQSNKIKITGTPSVTGVFNYTISLVGGCGQVNKNGTVIINSLPTGTIAASNNGVICEGSNVILTATGGNTYEWNLNNNPIVGAVAANYSATVAGLYSVKLISDKGCVNLVQQTATLVLNNAPVVGYSFDKYCINTPIIFTNSSTTNLSGPVTMLWDFGDNGISSSTSPTHSFLIEKTYAVKLTITPTNCPLIAKSLSKNIKIELPPLATRYPNVFALKNTSTKLTARSIGKTYAWSPSTGLSNASTISPNFNFTTATNYVIKITNDAGCIINDSLNVLIFDKADFFVPNAFSPNNDGRNDKLLIAAPGIETFQYFRIFNRWGNLVFETSNSSIFWDGTFKGMAQPAEVYSWFAEGISKSGNKIQRNGQTLILR
ncbi:MAG: hypothetical protein EBZ95_03185 [Chitinophagia bacterium]|nr:hypothetical protein [Chitinophagia bacterium]